MYYGFACGGVPNDARQSMRAPLLCAITACRLERVEILSPNCLLSQPQKTINEWYDLAVKRLSEMGEIPNSDEIWVNQKYTESVMFFAQQLFADSLVKVN